ncbi:MAG: energy transducer TonB [Aquisalinus sp.]|nr:energy transducer TonB [Aquisalinus sp.]
MQSLVRLILGTPLALVFTAFLFLVMYALITDDDLQLEDPGEQVKIDLGRKIQDTEIANQNAFERPNLDQPPPPPPAINTADFQPEVQGVSAVTPEFDANLDIGTGFNPDRDAQPLVRIPPQYPDRCQGRGNAGDKRVTVEFDVTPDGQTTNPRVVSTDDSCLNRYAERAVLNWKYQPKIVDGEATPRFGVRTTFVFRLEDE